MVIEAINLGASYGGRLVFSNISFSLAKGELARVWGKNGSGKSTLVKVLAALKEPCEGRLTCEARTIAFAAPFCHLPPRLRVHELGTMALHTQFERDHFHSVLSDFKLQNRRETLICELSSGSVQKVKIAVTASRNAGLFLFDEPYAHLDEGSVKICTEIIDGCRRRAAVIVTAAYPPADCKNNEKAVPLDTNADFS